MNPGDIGDAMRQAGRLRKDMDKLQEELKDRYVEGTAGDGLVRVTVNGQQSVVKVSIEPRFFSDSKGKVDVEMLEDLILAAVSQGLDKSKTLVREEADKLGGGLQLGGLLPGLFR
jgi:DNA-binding YbaB/EbfC family protein